MSYMVVWLSCKSLKKERRLIFGEKDIRNQLSLLKSKFAFPVKLVLHGVSMHAQEL